VRLRATTGIGRVVLLLIGAVPVGVVVVDKLTSRSPEGIFWVWPGDTEVILARKPG
jgi:hypothetical protein